MSTEAIEVVLRMDPLLEHPTPWTEEEFLALPPTVWPRVELLDGSLLVSPAPRPDHQEVVGALWMLLRGAAAEKSRALFGVDLRVAPERILTPDVVVTRERRNVTVQCAEDIVLVAEVVSPLHGRWRDRVMKHELYADAGISRYLLVEPGGDDKIVVTLYRLDGDSYREEACVRPGEVLHIDEPELDLDPAALMPLSDDS